MVSADAQMLEPGERGQRLETFVIDVSEAHIQPAQTRDLRQVGKAFTADPGPVKVQVLEVLPAAQVPDGIVRQELREVAIQFDNARERVQMFHAGVGDLGLRQIELSQARQTGYLCQIRVGYPGRTDVE